MKNINNFYLLTMFVNHSILDVWRGFEYSFGLVKLFWHGSKRDTWEHLLYAKLIMVFILNLAFSPNSNSYRKYNIQANLSLIKIREKWSTIQFDVIDLSIDFSVPMFHQSHKQMWCVVFFTCIKLVASALACARVITCIKWRRLHDRTRGP